MTTDIIVIEPLEIKNELPTDYNKLLLNIILEKKKQKQKEKEFEKQKELEKKNLNNTNNIKNECISRDYDSLIDISIDIKCSECNSRNLAELNGYYVCQSCGLYNDCIIDSGQEWRFYGADDSKGNDQSRCDIPTNELLPKTSIGSLVGFSTRENKTSKRIRNMNYWNAIPYRESSLLESFNNITIMAQNSGINQCIIEEAKYMYKKVTDIKSSRRTKKEAMKAGCVMLACKLKGVPRNCTEIAQIFKLKNNKTFRKSIKAFEEIWNNIQLKEGNANKTNKTNNSKNFNNNCNDRSDSDNDNDSSSDSDNESSDSDADDEVLYHNKQNLNKIIPKLKELDDEKVQLGSSHQLLVKPDKTMSTINIINTEFISKDLLPKEEILINKDITKDMTKDLTKDLNKDLTKDIPKEFIIVSKELNTNVTSKTLQECITKLHRFACILGFDDKIFEACRIILIHIENEKYLDKHTPLSRTSAVIYYIIDRLGININKHQILQTCEVSDVTINKCFQKLMKYKKEMLNIYIGM